MDTKDLIIDLRKCNKWIRKRFPNKDIISLDDLFGDYEELIDEVDNLEEEIRDLKQDMEENYKPLPPDPDPYERW
jgi:hypothetical protein